MGDRPACLWLNESRFAVFGLGQPLDVYYRRQFGHSKWGDVYMLVKTIRRLGFALVTGSVLLQSCAIGSDEVQLAAANSVESFFTALFSSALAQWVDAAFNV